MQSYDFVNHSHDYRLSFAETCHERAQETLILHSVEIPLPQETGTHFHVVTASNSSGEAVVQYFSGQTDEQPEACGSFIRLTWDDNSKLASICRDWGRLASGEYYVGKWGHGEGQNRVYLYPAFGQYKYHLRVYLNSDNDIDCDDIASQSVNSIGDFWRVFVRQLRNAELSVH